MLVPFLRLDVPTLVQVLITGNLLSGLLVYAYYYGSQHGKQWKNSSNVAYAKLFQALGFFLISLRHDIPDFLSANIGNSMLFVGFYFEALAMLCLIGEQRKTLWLLKCALIASIVCFNVTDMVVSNGAMRVITASIGSFAILLFPCLRLLLSPHSSGFKQLVGAMYTGFLALLVPRTLAAFLQPAANVLSNSAVQSLTFHAMVLLMIFSLAAYLLLMKEGEDNALATLATTDYLTGLPNRHNFFESAERLFSRYQFEGNPIGVLFLDIDFFKTINDRYGHAFGDLVLKELTAIIKDSVRPFDLLCRYGGEEFVVLLPDADTPGATKVAERIRDATSRTRMEGFPDFSFSVSVGVSADVPQKGDTLDQYINQADQAMYLAKNAGRDQVVWYRKNAS